MEAYDWIIDNSITILALTSVALTLISLLGSVSERMIAPTSWAVILIVIAMSFQFLPFLLFSIPLTIIPVLGLIATLIVYLSKKISEKSLKRYTIIQYVFSMILLLLAIEFAKSSANTWGSGPIYHGVFMIAIIIPLRHLTRELYPRPITYGLIDLSIGLFSMVLIVAIGFGTSEYNGEDTLQARKGLVFLSIGLTLEGLLLIYKSKKLDAPIV